MAYAIKCLNPTSDNFFKRNAGSFVKQPSSWAYCTTLARASHYATPEKAARVARDILEVWDDNYTDTVFRASHEMTKASRPFFEIVEVQLRTKRVPGDAAIIS